MASATTLNDGGFQTGSYDVTIDSYAYTLDTVDHELPIFQADAMTATGLPKGGAFVRGKQKLAVKIKAITGTPAPSQLVPFALSIHGFSSRNWTVTNLKIASSNEGANIRTYNADIVEYVNSIS
jgi:hypothetical protein